MNKLRRKISPALFTLTLICFFLPFITVSCRQEEIATLNGIDLAIGKTVRQPSIFGNQSKEEKIPADPLATIALISGVIGLGTSFIKAKKSAIAPAGAGIVGFILLLMLKSKIDSEIVKQGQGLLLVSYGFGFWLAFIFFISATFLNVYSLIDSQKDDEPTHPVE
ncbi:MAG: hypothetical protein KME31_29095 [Tolypothrix carrinoi HA7290-LM1]|jgi:hypothetical protein|nr:hypothetical protein [Tolypothrix carrinoi HA7290-LM1]